MSNRELGEHVEQWVRLHQAAMIPPKNLGGFEATLTELPWIGTHLDWSRLSGKVLDLSMNRDVAPARLTRHDYALAYYGPGRPGVAARLQDILMSLDELFWTAPGVRYLCGADLEPAGDFKFAFSDLAEYDGGSHLTVRV